MRQRQPAIRTVLSAIALLTSTVGMAGCTSASSASSAADTCPSSFTAAVLWSSPSSRASAVQFFDGTKLVGQLHIGVQGLSATDQTPLHLNGGVATFSKGDASHDESNIVAVSASTCAVSLIKLDEPVAYNLTTLGDSYLSISNLNRTSYLRTYAPGGQHATLTMAYPADFITAAVQDGDQVFAQAQSFDPKPPSLIVADAGTLRETARWPLPTDIQTSQSMTMAGGSLIIPIAVNASDRPDDRLLVVDPTDGTTRTIDLGSPSPFYVRAVGDTVYVAHTFLNPGFQPLSDYRHVSVVNMADGSVTGHDLTAGLSRMDVDATALAALGENADQSFVLHTYSLPDFTPRATVRLTPPADVPDAYAANVFLPER